MNRDEILILAKDFDDDHGCGSIGRCLYCMANFALEIANSRWIPIRSAGNPVPGMYWITFQREGVDGRSTEMAYYVSGVGWNEDDDVEVIAWMPLPNPYKEPE